MTIVNFYCPFRPPLFSFAGQHQKNAAMENEQILHKLNRIEKFMFGLKDILNPEELSEYTGFKVSYIYKLVSQSKIPYSKPNNGALFFDRKKIDDWLLQNPSKSEAEIRKEALQYTRKK
ncbi:helix-turn-helix domain-containing protein [Algoriphagus halophytocola]|nr:helix-turn-helix domain-containing protein [Algoriphagus sp. TR-M9]WBL44831.1 helix-turn-helix domain-containing protein [Algoriphagus sp. TR-M9]